jgi:hypothetical protein
MKTLSCLLMFSFLAAGCAQQPAPAPEPAAPAFTPTAHATVLQLMRAIPFGHSNIIFDTQNTDPDEAQAAAKAAAEKDGGANASAQYGTLYAGWAGVENSALALSETANLLMIPGRLCSNGLPAPIQNADWQAAVKGLADAGQAAYKAAQMKNLDAMVDVSGVMSDACAACHQVYRDQPEPKQRCTQ